MNKITDEKIIQYLMQSEDLICSIDRLSLALSDDAVSRRLQIHLNISLRCAGGYWVAGYDGLDCVHCCTKEHSNAWAAARWAIGYCASLMVRSGTQGYP